MSYEKIGGSRKCYEVIEEASHVIHEAVNSDTVESLPDSLQPCTKLKNEKDIYAYESEIFGWFQGTVQYNEQSASPATVRSLCEALTHDDMKPIEALSSMADTFFSQQCIPSSWDELVGELQEEAFDGSASGRQWIYQSCNEFGYFQTTEGDNHPFMALKGCSLDVAGRQMCEDVYKIKKYEGPSRGGGASEYGSDETYGARNIQSTNITMPNGSCDPWHSLGVVEKDADFYDPSQKIAEGVVPVFIDGTAHCRDMYAPDAFVSVGINDTQAVKDAHARIKKNVYSYIGYLGLK